MRMSDLISMCALPWPWVLGGLPRGVVHSRNKNFANMCCYRSYLQLRKPIHNNSHDSNLITALLMLTEATGSSNVAIQNPNFTIFDDPFNAKIMHCWEVWFGRLGGDTSVRMFQKFCPAQSVACFDMKKFEFFDVFPKTLKLAEA